MSEIPPPFVPVGAVARWRVVYDLLRPLKFGEVLTYEAIADALELDADTDRHVIQMASRRALRELLNIDHRGSKAVKNLGYRIAKPEEHITLGKDRNKRAGRQLVAAEAVSTKVDLTDMLPEQVKILELMTRGVRQQMEINRRVLAKQDQHSEAIDLLMRKVEDLEKGR